MPSTVPEARSRLLDLERADVVTYLRPHLDWLHGRLDVGEAAAVYRAVNEWEHSLSVSLTAIAAALAVLERVPDFTERKRALAMSTAQLAPPLARLANAVQRGNAGSIVRWRWAARAYGRSLANFVTDRQRARLAVSGYRRAVVIALRPHRGRGDVLSGLLRVYARDEPSATGRLEHRATRLAHVCERQDASLTREKKVRQRAEAIEARLQALGEYDLCDHVRAEEHSMRSWLLRLRSAERLLVERRRSERIIEELERIRMDLGALG